MNKDEQRRDDMKVFWVMILCAGLAYVLIKIQVPQRIAEWATQGRQKFVKR